VCDDRAAQVPAVQVRTMQVRESRRSASLRFAPLRFAPLRSGFGSGCCCRHAFHHALRQDIQVPLIYHRPAIIPHGAARAVVRIYHLDPPRPVNAIIARRSPNP
jgi:hypothetical protein